MKGTSKFLKAYYGLLFLKAYMPPPPPLLPWKVAAAMTVNSNVSFPHLDFEDNFQINLKKKLSTIGLMGKSCGFRKICSGSNFYNCVKLKEFRKDDR